MKQTRITIKEDGPSVRAELSDEGKMYFVGYAAVYNSRSSVILERGRMFIEILSPGCFDRVLQNPNIDVILTINHQSIHNLGRTISGNLSLTLDNIGLKFRAAVPNTTLGKDTWEMISRGDYTDCSFSFSVDESGEKWERDTDGGLLHTVKEVSGLYDVTICTLRGAYEQTIVDVERASRMFNEIEKAEADALKVKNEEELVLEAKRKARQREMRIVKTNSLKGDINN